jgi:hypothetical protein
LSWATSSGVTVVPPRFAVISGEWLRALGSVSLAVLGVVE